MKLWAELKKPQGAEVGPYGYLTNQLGHYVLGAAMFQLLGAYYLLPVLLYLLAWEVRHWNGWDSVIDTSFVASGALPAYVVLPIAVVLTFVLQKHK